MNRGAVSRERIVALALEIADTEGLAALTIRRLADALGTSAMAPYTYIGGKPELLEAMVEAAMATVPAPEPDKTPAAALREFFGGMYEALTRHPSAGHVMIAVRVAGPITQQRGERAVQALEAAGLTASQAWTAFLSLASFTVGSALVGAVRPTDGGRDPFDQGLTHLLTGFGADDSRFAG